jgi:hypothetical protein
MMRKLILAYLLVMTATTQTLSLAAAQTSVTVYPVADNYVDSKYPGTELDVLGRYGKVSVLYVGNSYDHGQDIWGSERIYIRFDLDQLANNRIIVQATLSLWQFYPPQSNQTYEAHRVLANWNEITQNWSNQPSWSLTKTSEAVAPSLRGVAVEWDITSDVKAWYSHEAPNYGTMIKVATEEHATDASSGFYSREYPVGPHEEWKPKLTIVLEGGPTATYTVTVNVSGLPSQVLTSVTVDGELDGSMSSDSGKMIMLDLGTAHTIGISGLVSGSPGVRYRCDANETQVTEAASHVFAYSPEYWVSFSAKPDNMFQTPTNGWYAENSTLVAKRTGPDVISTAPGTRLAFDGWQINEEARQTDLGTIIVSQPMTITAGYRTEYYLNVTSSIGGTNGSGWYTKDALASYSVEPPAVPAGGLLGILGLKHSFVEWIGQGSSIDFPSEPEGTVIMKEPTVLLAVWQEDWGAFVVDVGLLLLLLAVAGVAVTVRARKRRPSIQ